MIVVSWRTEPFDQAVSDLGQCRVISFRKQQPILDLPAQDPVLRRQIFVSQQEFLIGLFR